MQTCEEEHQTTATIEICHKEAHIARPQSRFFIKSSHHKTMEKIPLKSSHYRTLAHNLLKKQPFQDHPTTEDVKDIIAIKKAFPESFDRVGSLPGIYTMHLDPSIPPVQHARRKVPIECKEQIQKALQKMARFANHHSSD